MTNSEARKRAQEAAEAAHVAATIDAAPEVDPSATDSDRGPQIGPQGVEAIRAEWLNLCGPHDGGLPMACSCSDGDPRVAIVRLVDEIDRLTAEVARLTADLEAGDACGAVGCRALARATAAEAVVESVREWARTYAGQWVPNWNPDTPSRSTWALAQRHTTYSPSPLTPPRRYIALTTTDETEESR